MNPQFKILIYGWSAYLSSAAVILTLITGSQFFSVGRKHGIMNGLFSILQVLLLIPLVFLFNQYIVPPKFFPMLISSALGLGGILVSAFGQIRLLIGKINSEESLKFFPAGGAIGFWLIMSNFASFGSNELPAILIWIGIAAGAGYLLTAAGFLKGGQQDPLYHTGALLLSLCYPIWGLWLGRLILASLA